MTPRHLKRFLVGAAFAGLAVPGLAMAEPTCAYVLGQVDGVTVATPAVPIVVPGSDAQVQPVRVHVDDLEQSIIGYSVRVPGADVGTDGYPVFVPGISETVPSVSASLPTLDYTQMRCVNVDGISTPAVPVFVASTSLTTPGTAVNVPLIAINILGNPVTTHGQAIIVEQKTVIIPAIDTVVPGVPVGTPAETIVVDVNGTLQTARYLVPTP